MAIRPRQLALTAFLSACFTTLLATALAAQPTVMNTVPAPPEGCRVWEAHISYVIEQHKKAGASETALGEALSLAYAAYGKCVICATDKDMNENAVAALDAIQGVLSRGRDVALAAPRFFGAARP